MRTIIFIMCAAAITLSMNGCKAKGTTDAGQEAGGIETKAEDLVEKYWKLTELYGNPDVRANGDKEAHIIFHTDESRFSGDAGCNRISGTYRLSDNNGLSFSQAVATQMMCIDMETETRFLEALGAADNYSVRDDVLTLGKGQTETLARFVAVYLR